VYFLKHYEQPVLATIQLLGQLNVKVTNPSVNNAILSHPGYPSLLSISDSLTKWNVENVALTLDKENLEQYPFPLLAFIGKDFKVITKNTTDAIYYIDTDGKTTKENKDDFLNKWGGMGLLAQVDEVSGEKDYAKKKLKEKKEAKAIPILAALFLICICGAIFSFANSNSAINIFGYTSLLVLKLTGIFVSVLLLWYDIDKNNPTLKKICTGSNSKTNCNAILTAPAAKLFKIISWSEIGFIYFTGGFLTILLNSSLIIEVALLNVLSLPYLIYSVVYQKFVAKQWCRLCLMVQGILLLEFTIALVTCQLIIPASRQYINLPALSILLTCFSFPLILWYVVKPILVRGYKNRNKSFELARLKRNPEIFKAFLYQQKKIKDSPEGLGITLGNPQATNTIIKVCSPYCGPCAKAHAILDELLATNGDLKVQIIFTATNEPGDHLAIPVKHLLAIAAQNDEAIVRKALDDWYLADKKNYDVFASKYLLSQDKNNHTTPNELIKAIEGMSGWCRSTGISFTPTIFINGYQLPEMYLVEELKYLFNESLSIKNNSK